MLIETKNEHIITIAGDLASGKSTVTTMLSEELGYEIYRNGAYARKIAKEKGLDITQYNEYVKEHPEIDQQIEKSAQEYAKQHDHIIVDARLGWFAVPHSFKIYLTVDINVAAARAFHDPNRKETEKFETIEEQKQDMLKRYALENDRYFNLYGIHKEDMTNYDLVLDTTNITPEEAKNKIKEEYFKWLENKK